MPLAAMAAAAKSHAAAIVTGTIERKAGDVSSVDGCSVMVV
ncbi:MAG TPA: hypothetical protein VNC18_23225 [Gemmatimonadaceae bacterium]|jgi:hypothetical protein|nr:hypothetical protein [Gemmatimonadaceae bacterium]